VLHRAAYQALGLNWTYDAHEVDEAELAAWVSRLGPTWRGLSLTSPLKQRAVDLCAGLDAAAQVTGAVNTLVLAEAGSRWGHNTDVPGFVAAWRERGIAGGTDGRSVRRARVLGGGATARSAMAALGEVGCREVTVAMRSPQKAAPLRALGERLGLSVEVCVLRQAADGGEVDLLVSTLPAGVLEGAGPADLVDRLVACSASVCDVVDAPRGTALTRAARSQGRVVAEGFDLLLHQAARQVELMTDRGAPLEVMRATGMAALARREDGT
jgi:shikimate dehydrogenase